MSVAGCYGREEKRWSVLCRRAGLISILPREKDPDLIKNLMPHRKTTNPFVMLRQRIQLMGVFQRRASFSGSYLPL